MFYLYKASKSHSFKHIKLRVHTHKELLQEQQDIS